MTNAFKHAVFEEMLLVTEGQIPEGVEALTEMAHQNQPAAVLLPLYMYCFYPREWQEYTLFTSDALPPIVNHAAHMAFRGSRLHADKKIKRYWYGAAAISHLPEHAFLTISLDDWARCVAQQYQRLCQRTCSPEPPASVRRRPTNAWYVPHH